MNAVSQANQVATQVETQVAAQSAVVCARPQKRHAIKSALKSAIAQVSKVLPDSIFGPAYDLSFAAYRKGLRALYSRHIFAARLGGKEKDLRRAQTVKRVMPFSLVGSSGLESTFDVAENTVAMHVAGAFVECGVARGGSSPLSPPGSPIIKIRAANFGCSIPTRAFPTPLRKISPMAPTPPAHTCARCPKAPASAPGTKSNPCCSISSNSIETLLS